MNSKELETKIRDALFEYQTDPVSSLYVVRVLNEAYKFAYQHFVKSNDTLFGIPYDLTIVAGQSEYTMPEVLWSKRIEHFQIPSPPNESSEPWGWVRLPKIDWKQSYRFQTQRIRTYYPSCWSQMNNTIYIYPPSLVGFTAKLVVSRRLTPLGVYGGRITSLGYNALTLDELYDDRIADYASDTSMAYISICDHTTGELKALFPYNAVNESTKTITLSGPIAGRGYSSRQFQYLRLTAVTAGDTGDDISLELAYLPNLLTAPSDLSDASWVATDVTVATNTVTDPDGTTEADTLTATAGNGTVMFAFTAATTRDYTVSMYVKRKTGVGDIEMDAGDGVWAAVAVGATWTRVSVTATITAGNRTAGIRIVDNADAIYVWGMKLETDIEVTVSSSDILVGLPELDGATTAVVAAALAASTSAAALVTASASADPGATDMTPTDEKQYLFGGVARFMDYDVSDVPGSDWGTIELDDYVCFGVATAVPIIGEAFDTFLTDWGTMKIRGSLNESDPEVRDSLKLQLQELSGDTAGRVLGVRINRSVYNSWGSRPYRK